MAVRILQILGVVIATCEAHSPPHRLRVMRSEASHGHHSASTHFMKHRPASASLIQQHQKRQGHRQLAGRTKRFSSAHLRRKTAKERRLIEMAQAQSKVNLTLLQIMHSDKSAFFVRKMEIRNGMVQWLTKRSCAEPCGIKAKEFWNVKSECKDKCIKAMNIFREASDNVRASGVEQPIRFPGMDASTMRLHASSDKTDYDQMLFAGGVKHDGKTSFVARLCTHGCYASTALHDEGAKFYDSTLILGEIEQQQQDAWHWKNAAEHWVEHDDGHLLKGEYVGPEDPRMDVVDGSRFLTVGLTESKRKAGCPADLESPEKKVDIHQLFFVPIDNQRRYKTCRIHPDRIDPCSIQKNWASVVPRGSEDIYYVFSVWPLQVIRFTPKSCEAKFITERTKRRFDPMYAAHGGTRYIFGGQVPEGDLFWSVGHSPAPWYMPVLIGLLVRSNSSAAHPTFELIGVSCPITRISSNFTDPKTPKDESWEHHLLITTSIVDFDPVADISTVTFQVHDKENYQTRLTGIGNWLKTAHKEYKDWGTAFRCDQLH